MSRADAIVIGSGPNGLVAANLLADAGWDVLVLEAQPRWGGAVASDDSVREGWVHDTFSSFYPLAAGSPTMRALGLERYGLEWVQAPSVVAHAYCDADGADATDGADSATRRWAVLHRDEDDTAAGLDRLAPGDGEAWLALCRRWRQVGDDLVGALMSPFPPVRHGARLAMRLPRAGGLPLVRELLLPMRRFADETFSGPAPGLLLAGNAAHADIPMDAPGSGLMGLLLAMLGQHVGYPVPRGGAGRLAEAMVQRLESRGGRVVLGCHVDEVLVRDGRARGVRVSGGEELEARCAVLADVSAPALYGGLVGWEHLPARLRRRMRRFEWDPGTVKVDWALREPIPWEGTDLTPRGGAGAGTVHLADSIDALARAGAQTAGGAAATRGLVLIGQMATTDPSRAPDGAESAWAYTHVPHDWASDDEAVAEVADQMAARIEERAPGFRDAVLAQRVLGPRDLQARDENLVNGSLNGGTAALQQQLVWRPVPGLGRAETPVRGLYLASASAHPGGGVHGACGANAARAALAHNRVRRILHPTFLGRTT